MNKSAVLSLLLLLCGQHGYAQGFVNLDFEATALAPNGSPSTVSTSVGLFGWNASIGGVSRSTILYNDGTLGNSSIAILGNGNLWNPVIAGNFSVELTAGANGDAAISQTGLVPTNTHSILFASYAQGSGLGNLSVMLNSQIISISTLTTTANYTLYWGDVSAFAGQTATLTFFTDSYLQGFKIFMLDGISFSSIAVPEPSTFSLFALGSCLFLGWRWRKSSRAATSPKTGLAKPRSAD